VLGADVSQPRTSELQPRGDAWVRRVSVAEVLGLSAPVVDEELEVSVRAVGRKVVRPYNQTQGSNHEVAMDSSGQWTDDT
jgi:hypothetical protein